MKKSKIFCLALAAGVMSFTLASCGGMNFPSQTIIKPSDGGSESNGGSITAEDEKRAIYELALKSGYEGTYEEWLQSIKGENGLSAYEIYKKYHPDYKGSEEEWINDLVNGKLANMIQITLNYRQTDMKNSKVECKKGEICTLPTPTKDGFRFLGWRDENGNSIDVSSFRPTENMVLYANWDQIKTTTNSIYTTYYNLGDPNIEYCSRKFSDTIKTKDYGYDYYDSHNEYNMELDKLNQALKKKYAGYLINPVQFWDSQAYIDIFKESNSPVVFWNRELNKSAMNSYDKAYYVGFEADEIGRLQGKMAADYINQAGFSSLDRNGDGKLGVIVVRGEKGHLDSDSRTLYAPMYLERGLIGGNRYANGTLNYNNYITTNTWNKVEIKAMVEGKDMSGMTWDPLSASSEVARVLCEKGNEIDLVLSNNDGMALGILKNSIFINSGIPIWGIDGMNDTKIQINKPNSQLKGTIEMNRDEMVRVSVEVLMNLINGDEFSKNLNITNDKTAWENDENKIWYDSAKKALRIHHSIITK